MFGQYLLIVSVNGCSSISVFVIFVIKMTDVHLQIIDEKCNVNITTTRYVRKVMRLIRENSFNWIYVYTHLIFFKITSLSIKTPLPAVLPRFVARLEVLNWDLFQSIRHGSLHVLTVKNVQAAVTNALKEIPVQDFQASYDAWQNRWQRCIDAQGCYFEEY